ncbi:hypothetical protein HO173_001576 [Letharia columbiana]|uniref:Uncharacterized protein n=1 Tax=Letharia columbiana TaxID=112416 RepID=A0A8H6L901_9LECA|nr:uncharacterized protein HO173_001576 [Letharia columbiana]KAF6239968.1 hypothetical protein HO173_001576 [Letharia columbiana]
MHAVLFLLTIALTLFSSDDKATKTGFEKQPAPQSKVMKVREHSPASLMQKFAGMDTRVKNFIFKKTVGLLEAWQGRPPPKASGDIESGLLNATKSPPTNNKSQDSPDRDRSEDITGNVGGNNTYPQGTPPTSTRPIDLSLNQQPQFTEGPARFVVVNDGSKDCLALLVTEVFVAKSRDLYEDSHHLSGKQGPLQQVRRDARNAEAYMSLVRESLEMAQNQEQADELGELSQKRETELIEARQRKKPLTPFIEADSEEDENSNEIYNQPPNENANNENEVQNTVRGADVSRQQPVVLAIDAEVPASSDEVPADEDSVRQAAWEDYNDKLETFHKVQDIFDDRQQAYETNLAKFQDGIKTGIYNMSRSEFDRNRVRHGQKITRALIDAEEAFDGAKAYAQAVGATGSDYEQTNYFGNYEESMPENQMALYNASKDFSDIYTWMASVPETGDPEEFEPVDVDDWDSKEVDQTDSISQIDFEEYRKPIDQWQYECALARGDGPEEYYLGPVNIEFLERRHSVSLSRSNVGESDVGI